MSPLLLLIGLQAFQAHLDQDALRLHLDRIVAVVDNSTPWAAWVPDAAPSYSPYVSRQVVHVREDFLNGVDDPTLDVIAAHESCHLYLISRRGAFHGEIDLHHAMMDGCVEWVLADRYDSVMQAVSCGQWYPNEVIRYYQRKGIRRKCVEAR